MTRRAQYETTQCKIASKISYLRKKQKFIAMADFDEDPIINQILRDGATDQAEREVNRCKWVLHRLDRAIERNAVAAFRAVNARLDYLAQTASVYLATYQTHAQAMREAPAAIATASKERAA
jgi:hypothetical protein